MSEVLPVIKVKHKEYNIEMVINECDFDENVHQKLNEKEAPAKKKEKKNVDDELKALMGEN